jgi:microcystin-dependent protein
MTKIYEPPLASSVPTGVVLPFAGATAPTGFLFCDGSSQLRSTYAALFAVIGTTYGSVDGTHFNLPDTRGIFIRGVGSQTFGAKTYTGTLAAKQNDNMISHTHTDAGHLHATGFNQSSGGGGASVPGAGNANPATGNVNTGASAANIQAAGSGTETHAANIAMNHIIKE